MEGSISDRPWGMTLGALGTSGFTGLLTLASNKGKFRIRFSHGAVVDATSPLQSDTALRIAMLAQLITWAQARDIAPQVAYRVEQGGDEVDIVGVLAGLTKKQIGALRRRVITQRAARTFIADRGEFVLETCAPVWPEYAGTVDIHAVIYLGARVHLCQQRLLEELELHGRRFAFTAGVGDALPRFGFTELEGPIIAGLRAGASLDALEAVHPDPRTVHAVVYALVTCLACAPAAEAQPVIGIHLPARSARGTDAYDTQPSLVAAPPVEDDSALARDAFRCGQRALDDGELDQAISALAHAVDLAPCDLHYKAILAWAWFRAAPDPRAVAETTRQMLGRAILESPAPVIARFLLGRVERILGYDQQALRHFFEVIRLQPDHREAAAEIRILTQRLAPSPAGGWPNAASTAA